MSLYVSVLSFKLQLIQYELEVYGHHGFLATKDISEEACGYITYPFSEKQKLDKMMVKCGLPFPSAAYNRERKALLICSVPAGVVTEIKVLSSPKGILGVNCFLQPRTGFPLPQTTPFIFLLISSIF